MKTTKTILFTLLLCAVAIGGASLPAQGGPLTLKQDGWDTGGPLRITFEGEDLDDSGYVENYELTAFEAEFLFDDGRSTTWSITDLTELSFIFESPSDYLLFVSNSSYSLVDFSFEGEAVATVFDEFLFPVATTISSPQVVPEPSTFLLSALGLVAAAAVARQRSRSFGAVNPAKIRAGARTTS